MATDIKTENNPSFWTETIKASIMALLISLVLTLATVLVISFVDITDLVADIINQSIRGISVLIACIFSFKERKNGWLKGLTVGIIFSALFFVVYALIGGEFVFDISLLINILSGIAMGVVSGIIAVNTRK